MCGVARALWTTNRVTAQVCVREHRWGPQLPTWMWLAMRGSASPDWEQIRRERCEDVPGMPPQPLAGFLRANTSPSHRGPCLWAPRVHQRQGGWSQWRVKTGAALSFRKHNLCLRDSCKLCNPPTASVWLLGTPEYLHCLENTYLSSEPNFNGPSAKPQAQANNCL